jgi:hypothetical protein
MANSRHQNLSNQCKGYDTLQSFTQQEDLKTVSVCVAVLTSDEELWKSAVGTECRPLIENKTEEVHLE